MFRHTLPLAAITMFVAAPAAANQLYGSAQTSAPQVYRDADRGRSSAGALRGRAARREMGGGFIEFLFNGTGEPPRQQRVSVPQYIDPRMPGSLRARAAARAARLGAWAIRRAADRRARAPRDGPALSAAGRLL